MRRTRSVSLAVSGRALPTGLSAQPGRFESLAPLVELVDASDLPVAQRVNLVEMGVDLDPTSPAASSVPRSHEHAVPGVHEFLRGRLERIPDARPALEIVSNRLQAVGRALLDGIDDDVRIKDGELGMTALPEHLELEGAAHGLDVLPRHRVAQYRANREGAPRGCWQLREIGY